MAIYLKEYEKPIKYLNIYMLELKKIRDGDENMGSLENTLKVWGLLKKGRVIRKKDDEYVVARYNNIVG